MVILVKLEPFDILLIIKKGLIGELIGEVTESIYTHAALVLDNNHIIDIAFFTPVEVRHINYRLGEFDAFRLIYPLEDVQKREITEFYQKAINARYDFGEFLGTTFTKLSLLDNPIKFICSSLVFDAFKSAGITLVKKDGVVTPADLSLSPLLKKVNRSEFTGLARMEPWRPGRCAEPSCID